MRILYYIEAIRIRIYSLWIRMQLPHSNRRVLFTSIRAISGGKNITIGQLTFFGANVRLSCWGKGRITIGESCNFGDDNFITALNNISIGNNILTGRNVFISDNSHGSNTSQELDIPPINRCLYSKGSVTIGNNVWIGNNVCILSNVTIGNGVVIGANSVVTHDIPAYSIACGQPARIIKTLK